MAPLSGLLQHKRANAILGWGLTSVVAFGAIESLLTNALLWGGFAFLIVTVVAIPGLFTGDWMVMVPWPLLFFAALAITVRSFDMYLEMAGYIAVATLALIVVVEINVFTPVEMSRRFAVVFAVLTTMAIQGLWIVAQFYSDRWLDTEFLHSQTELQWDIVIVTAVGIVMGGIFEWYFERFVPIRSYEQTMNSARSQ